MERVRIMLSDSHQLLPVKAMDPGGPVVGCHDGSEYPLSLGDGSRSWVGNVNVLFPYASRLFVEARLGVVVHTLLRSAGS